MSSHDDTSDSPATGPLSGVRVIDMTTVLMGPFATQTMGDYGADVIKVEAPQGDLMRQVGPSRSKEMGGLFLNVNRSKRSITLDLKQPEGREALLKLCETADVLIFNVRAQAMKRLGLSYEDVSAINSRIIYAGLYGYGQDGPYAPRPAYDDLIQGASTIPHLFTRVDDGKPRYVPVAIADRVVGLSAMGAILATLYNRERTGQGQSVEIPMFETMLNFILSDHLGGLTYNPPLDNGGYNRHLSADRRPYETKDGYICALVYTDGHWKSFFDIVEHPDFPDLNERFRDFAYRAENIDEVYAEIAGFFLVKTTEQWMDLLDAGDVPFMPMHDLESVLSDPHLVETNFFRNVEHSTEGSIRSMAVPAKWSITKAEPTRLAPRLGEHSIEVLLEAGYSREDIIDMLDRKIAGSTDSALQKLNSENSA
jgi:crotonobetainyl-CoA:carnitine CoA-transferase CaiB-like acyl-CoA transferase